MPRSIKNVRVSTDPKVKVSRSREMGTLSLLVLCSVLVGLTMTNLWPSTFFHPEEYGLVIEVEATQPACMKSLSAQKLEKVGAPSSINAIQGEVYEASFELVALDNIRQSVPWGLADSAYEEAKETSQSLKRELQEAQVRVWRKTWIG